LPASKVEAALTVITPVCSTWPVSNVDTEVAAALLLLLYAGGAVPETVGNGPLVRVTPLPNTGSTVRFTDSPKAALFAVVALTVIVTGPDVLLAGLASTAALTVAVLAIDGQLALLVVAVSVMVLVLPTVIVPKLQVSVVPPETGEAGEQEAALGPPTVQVRPLGNVSVSTTLVELAVPPAVTLTV
jgi:hypothetical protein